MKKLVTISRQYGSGGRTIGKILADIIITVVYGCNIVQTAHEVQEKVMSLVQASTGIENAEVNVHVSGIAFDK